MMRDRSRFNAIIILLAGIFIGFYLGFLVDNHLFDLRSISTLNIEIRQGQKSLINPLLECNDNEQIGQKEFGNLEAKLMAYIDKKIKANAASHISIYFRDLNNGPWIGINEREKFSPASLLKLPLMISYYKEAEDDPKILDRELKFNASEEAEIKGVTQTITPGQALDTDHKYSVDELIKRMIVYSDNKAWTVLIENLSVDKLYETLSDIGFSLKDDNFDGDFISVKDYAAFFRLLYNASYLSRSYSEKALENLTEVKYTDGLVSKLPKSIKVAHKFGERELKDSKQLHDCGIVYYPNHPYLICLMTRGSITSDLQTVIQDISELTYKMVDLRYRGK